MRVGHQLGLLVVACTIGGLSVATLLWERSQDLETAGRAVLEGELLRRDHGRLLSLADHFATTADMVVASGNDYLEIVAQGQADALDESFNDLRKTEVGSRFTETLSDLPKSTHVVLAALRKIGDVPEENEARREEIIATLDGEMIHLQQVLDRMDQALDKEVEGLRAERDRSEASLQRTSLLAGLVYLAGIVVAWRWSVRSTIRPLLALAHSAETASQGGGKLEVCEQGPEEVRILSRSLGAFASSLQAARDNLEEKVQLRTAELQETNRELESRRDQYRELVETTQAVPWQWDRGVRRFTYVGPQA